MCDAEQLNTLVIRRVDRTANVQEVLQRPADKSKTPTAVCSMQYAVCSMQYAVCSMQYDQSISSTVIQHSLMSLIRQWGVLNNLDSMTQNLIIAPLIPHTCRPMYM